MKKSLWTVEPSEARSILGKGLEGEPDFPDAIHDLDYLASRLGEWPPLLDLVNAFLRKSVEFEYRTVQGAILRANRALDKRGLVYFDVNRIEDRNETAAKTIEICLEWLSPEERERFYELAAFPADTEITLDQIHRLWSGTCEIDGSGTIAICRKLHDLSLLLKFDKATGIIQISEVIREYLKNSNPL